MSSTLEVLSNDLASAVDRVAHHVVAIHARRRIPASGIVWRPGLIVAADHTIHKDDDVRISRQTGGDVRARVIGRDVGTDLCVLKIEEAASLAEPIAPAVVSSASARVGQLALTVGRPGADVTASLGVVSAVGPAWRTWRGGTIDQFIRLDLAVYDGFSGAPLVNAAGEVVGLCTSGLARGAAVAVPAATINRVLDRLLASGGATRRGYLGISTQPVQLPESVRERLAPIGTTVPKTGLMLVDVQHDTCGDRAGLLLGDILIALDDQRTEDARDVLAMLGPESVGREMRLSLVRAGAPLTLTAVIDELPTSR
jgi:S1-C subfamily serine protease